MGIGVQLSLIREVKEITLALLQITIKFKQDLRIFNFLGTYFNSIPQTIAESRN